MRGQRSPPAVRKVWKVVKVRKVWKVVKVRKVPDVPDVSDVLKVGKRLFSFIPSTAPRQRRRRSSFAAKRRRHSSLRRSRGAVPGYRDIGLSGCRLNFRPPNYYLLSVIYYLRCLAALLSDNHITGKGATAPGFVSPRSGASVSFDSGGDARIAGHGMAHDMLACRCDRPSPTVATATGRDKGFRVPREAQLFAAYAHLAATHYLKPL